MQPALERIDGYLHQLPARRARVEHIGPFDLFVPESAEVDSCARPWPGAEPGTPGDLTAVLSRQKDLGLAVRFSWIPQTAPWLAPALEAVGLSVTEQPLLALEPPAYVPAAVPGSLNLHVLGPEDNRDLVAAVAVVAFSHPGRHGEEGAEALRDAVIAGAPLPDVTWVGIVDDLPVVIGGHIPLGEVSEVISVGTLPAFRGRGLGIALTSAVIADAFGRGASLVFTVPADDELARVGARLGFGPLASIALATG